MLLELRGCKFRILCDPTSVEAMPPLTVDEPTIRAFQVNDSPFAGLDGNYDSPNKERLERELLHIFLRLKRRNTRQICCNQVGGTTSGDYIGNYEKAMSSLFQSQK